MRLVGSGSVFAEQAVGAAQVGVDGGGREMQEAGDEGYGVGRVIDEAVAESENYQIARGEERGCY